MADPVIYSGAQLTISFARENSGRYPGAEFFESLDRADKAKLMVLFKMLGDHGRIANPEKLGNLKNGLFEFKSHQIRMPFAYAATRRLVVITHGFIKKSPKASSEEISRAWRIFNEDQASAKLGLVRKQSE
jgi:hypothetical protein